MGAPRLDGQQIRRFRRLLEERRRLLSSGVSFLQDGARQESEELAHRLPQEDAELSADNLEEEVTFCSLESEAVLLRQVNEALERLEAGTYGECVACGGPISLERLEALPHASLCIECARSQVAGSWLPLGTQE